MSAKIVTKFLSKKHSGDGVLHIDFNSYSQNKIALQTELVGSKNTDIIWEIYSENQKLDTNDLNRGKNAEFLVLKSYAGSRDKPHDFLIVCKNSKGLNLASFTISVFATPEILEAYWGTSIENKIYEASINRNFTAIFNGVGLYNIPLHLDVYFVAKKGEDVKVESLSKVIHIKSIYDIADFYVNKEILNNHKMFFLGNTPTIFMEYISNSTLLDLTGNMRDLVIAKAYFIIKYKNHILFNGKFENHILNITFSINSLVVEEKNTTISPVVVATEEYFTQKYEPCKYEKIFYKHGESAELELFDEDKPTKKDKDGKLSNSKVEISVIVPPVGSKNVKDLKIRLEKVETKQCSFNDDNKKLANYDEGSIAEETLPHKGRVINTKNLDEAKIQYIFDKPDKKITIKPTFNYKYGKDTAWEFLKHYFLFSTLLDSKDVLQNELKGKLIGWEAESKGIIDVHRIGLETCRYQKGLYLKTYADVAWAFHSKFDNPYIPEYYNDNKSVKFVEGLDEEIDQLVNSPLLNNFSATIISPALGSSFIRKFIADIIKDMAERYGFAFTAYYDFDESGKKNSKQIDYGETHPKVFKALIAGVVTLEILIDVLLIIITEGAALANFVSKAGKVAKVMNKSGKLVDKGLKAEEILAKHSKTFQAARTTKAAKSTFELMKGSYYKGYRFVYDEDIGIQPILEERVKISPLLNLGVSQEKKLGELIIDKTPVGMLLNVGKSATGGFGLGVSALFLKKISYTKAGSKIEAGKQAVGWYRAATYPLKIVNYGLETVYNLLAFATEEMMKKVFGAEAEFEKDITAHLDLDFWLKIQNASNKLDLVAMAKGESKKDKSSISVAPSGAFTVRLKLSGNVANKVVVRAMQILTWNNKQETKMQEMTAEGGFEVEGNIFIERRYYFKADKKPYHEDKIVFTGLAGEYEYKIKTRKRDKEKIKKEEVIKNQEPTQFILIEPCQLVFNSSEMTKNPSDDK
ncbi:hypothetical protein [Frigoriflavimonas asaccharolytica]|uniref:Uncharacterized protein n=1 Tax=Frigoriflavimonas asaccharolytica TaxID=2735899 RepID=A0A8J8GAN1_9FLAO|nr:hypothetical protein [Frigoriflavimonas asaccharolytica]NRS94103.1 hypothetical protein [Frigoriflavimonas asaccharolytica]